MLRTFAICAFGIALAVPAVARDQLVVGAMGDSISTGFNAQRLGDNREFSWSTGTGAGLRSYRRRIEETHGLPVVSYNEAIAGSVAADLNRQTSRLLRHSPDYVTITIGANDVCRWGEDYEPQRVAFEEELRGVLDRLITANDQMTIVLAPIPRLYNLWEVAHGQPGCQEVWEMFNICNALLGRDVTQAQREAFAARWEHANQTIEQIARSYPDQVRFNQAIADLRFEWRHVSSKDCFHPSVAGQNMLAEIAWQMILADD
jgi:lysophospholipase L1-like esterase